MKSILHRKDKLIITTLDVIDEIGIMNLSTREIAAREGVSEATLFRHYKNKNDLLMSVLEYFTQFDNDLYQTTLLKNLSPLDSIKFLINTLAEFYENYPAITVLTQLTDTLRYEPELEDKVRSIISLRSQFLEKMIEEAKKRNEIKNDIDTENIADIISGAFREICLKWRLNRDFSLKERITSSLDAILISFGL